MQCKARYCREKKELPFPLKSGYFTELRCPNLANEAGIDPELCDRCHVKAAKAFSPHCQQGQYQGKIDEPYFDCSWLFGSDRFWKFQTMPGNQLPPDEFARAEAAQKIAQQGNEMKGKKSAPPPAPSSSTPSSTKSTPVKNTSKAQPVLGPPTGVELLDPPLEAEEIVVLHLKQISRNTKSLWKDSRGGLYEVTPQGGVGKSLPDFPESTSEDES